MDAAGIEYILRELGSEKIKVRNNTVIASCPFAPYTHGGSVDRHPSFGMDIASGGTSKWGCHACKNGATQTYSIIFRYQDYTGVFRQDLLDYIHSREGQSLAYQCERLEYRPARPIKNPQYISSRLPSYEPTFQIENYQEVLSFLPNYALERGITVAQAIRWKLGWLRWGMVLADGYVASADRLFFTIFSYDQKMVGWSGRRLEDPPEGWNKDQYWPAKYHHAGEIKKERYLYGEHFVVNHIRHGFVTESFMDVLNLDRFGVKNVLAIMGASASFEQITKLTQWFDKVYVLQHGDAAGKVMAEALEAQLMTLGTACEIIQPFEGHKDSGTWSRELTHGLLHQLGVYDEHCKEN